MNHSERLAFLFLEQTRAQMADPSFHLPDWSTMIMIVSLAALAFICTLLARD